MNTGGFIRGPMSKSMDSDKFLLHFFKCLIEEFNFKAVLVLDKDNYNIYINNYKVSIYKDKCKSLKEKGAYALDKYILTFHRMD